MQNIPHKTLPADLKKVIFASKEARLTWDDITPLAQNEWICLITSAKTEKGRLQRIKRAADQLTKGQRRPCCWPGCPHR
jgi:uncharacterized protein YdeI (YjbR/CyaY-like superfamily)